MMLVNRLCSFIFVSSFLVVVAFPLIALSVAEAQTTIGKPQPILKTSYKWASLTERQREIYTRGFVETVSVILYGHSQKGNEQHAKIFSEWALCAERQPLSSWLTLDWSLRGETDKTVAAQLYDIAPMVCKESTGKGEKSWRPVWLLKPAEWKSLSLHDRAIYLMAYAETVYATTRRAKDTANERKLNICIASVGIEGLISTMEQTEIDWQFPPPWSVSLAFGRTCKGSE